MGRLGSSSSNLVDFHIRRLPTCWFGWPGRNLEIVNVYFLFLSNIYEIEKKLTKETLSD